MRVVHGKPPIFDEIVRAFPLASRPGTIFAWGDVIYFTGTGVLPPELKEHEGEHGKRQGKDVRGWWTRYIAEPQFRLDEEIAAHIVELRYLYNAAPNRHRQKMAIEQTAKRLVKPLYGYRHLINYSQAETILRKAVAAGGG